MKLRILLSFAIALPLAAEATTIDFTGLPGGNGTNFTSWSQNGFTVADQSGGWRNGQSFGNPVSSIFSGGSLETVRITRNGGGFFFLDSVDLADAGSSLGPSYSISLGGVAGPSGGDLPRGFTTILNPMNGLAVSWVDITMGAVQTSSYNIDNIVVRAAQSVPESGSTLAMLGLVTAGLVGVRRRRS
jgi:hypothetical protein